MPGGPDPFTEPHVEPGTHPDEIEVRIDALRYSDKQWGALVYACETAGQWYFVCSTSSRPQLRDVLAEVPQLLRTHLVV